MYYKIAIHTPNDGRRLSEAARAEKARLEAAHGIRTAVHGGPWGAADLVRMDEWPEDGAMWAVRVDERSYPALAASLGVRTPNDDE